MRLLDDDLYTAVMVYLQDQPLKDVVALWMAFQKLKEQEEAPEDDVA